MRKALGLLEPVEPEPVKPVATYTSTADPTKMPQYGGPQTQSWGVGAKPEPVAPMSTITLFDGVAVADFDGLPASASRWL